MIESCYCFVFHSITLGVPFNFLVTGTWNLISSLIYLHVCRGIIFIGYHSKLHINSKILLLKKITSPQAFSSLLHRSLLIECTFSDINPTNSKTIYLKTILTRIGTSLIVLFDVVNQLFSSSRRSYLLFIRHLEKKKKWDALYSFGWWGREKF